MWCKANAWRNKKKASSEVGLLTNVNKTEITTNPGFAQNIRMWDSNIKEIRYVSTGRQ